MKYLTCHTRLVSLPILLLIASCGVPERVSHEEVPFNLLSQESLEGDGDRPEVPTIILAKQISDFGVYAEFMPIATRPHIKNHDYKTHFLALVTLGGCANDGFRLVLERLTWSAGTRTLWFYIRRLTPQETDDGYDNALSWPSVVVAIPKEYWPNLVECVAAFRLRNLVLTKP